MMKPMYDLPSEVDVEKVVVTAAFVRGDEDITVIKKAAGELPAPETN
jgi:ATP-dependent protease Clp ATPase subunit